MVNLLVHRLNQRERTSEHYRVCVIRWLSSFLHLCHYLTTEASTNMNTSVLSIAALFLLFWGVQNEINHLIPKVHTLLSHKPGTDTS